jgi:hypothetical protein
MRKQCCYGPNPHYKIPKQPKELDNSIILFGRTIKINNNNVIELLIQMISTFQILKGKISNIEEEYQKEQIYAIQSKLVHLLSMNENDETEFFERIEKCQEGELYQTKVRLINLLNNNNLISHK